MFFLFLSPPRPIELALLLSYLEVRERRLRDLLLVAEFRLVDPRLGTTGVSEPLLPETKKKKKGNEEVSQSYFISTYAKRVRSLHFLDLTLLSFQVTDDSTVRSIHAPSLQTQLHAALLGVLYPNVSERYPRSYGRRQKKTTYFFDFLKNFTAFNPSFVASKFKTRVVRIRDTPII